MKLRKALTSRGVRILCKRGYPVRKALLACWEMEKVPLINEKSTEDHEIEEADTALDAAEVAVEAAEMDKSISNRVEKDYEKIKIDTSMRGNLPGNRNIATTGYKTCSDVSSSRSSGMQGLLKAFGFRQKYGGQWDEDIMGVIEIYELAADMCNITNDEMLKGLPIMLDGAALSYYASHINGKVGNYKEAIDLLLSWFTSDEQRSRLLQEWHDTRLTKWFERSPDKSQLAVFREMSAHLGKIQRQLDRRYREDIFLRDQLITAADISDVKRVLKIQLPATAHDANQKIASMLSSEMGSAQNYSFSTKEADAYFGIGQKYRGKAERNIKRYPNRMQRSNRRNKLSRVKGCWVCGEPHMANKFHSRVEVEKAVQRLRGEKAFVAIEDVFNVLMANEDDSSLDYDEDHADSSEYNSGLHVDEIKDLNVELEAHLANKVYLHSCGFLTNLKDEMDRMETALVSTERHSEFNGIVIDTGANRLSIMSLNQYRSYCREFGIVADIQSDGRNIHGLGSKLKTIGTTSISIPFPEFGLTCDISFHILREDCKSLLSRRDLKNTGIDLSVQRDCLLYKGTAIPLAVKNDLLVYEWTPEIALFTYDELKKLHRAFGHPSVSALYNLLKRARKDECHADVRDAIQTLTEKCRVCTELATKPKRFKLTVCTEDGRFNSIVAADIMYIDNKPILHVVDEATHFSAATFLRNVSSEHVWNAFIRIWTNVYMGPPDYLRIDQGSQFISREFKVSAEVSGIQLLTSPVENPSSMTHVERYHAPLRRAFLKLKLALPKDQPQDILQMALHCVNSTVGPEGLCPTLCVFGALPKPARNTPAPQQIERAKAIDEAMKDVQKEQATRRLKFAEKYRGPFGKENTKLERLHHGAPVRVYRAKTNKWEGPFKFVSIEGETVVVQLPNGRKIFRTHVVKPDNSIDDVILQCTENRNYFTTDESDEHRSKYFKGDLGFVAEMKEFSASRQKEIDGLLQQGVFKVVPRSTVPRGKRIYGMRWVDTMKKRSDGKFTAKSRLVAQNYRDHESRCIPTKAPTISRFGQRLALCMAALFPEKKPYTRDVTQAYIQSRDRLLRKVYLKPPSEMQIPSDKVLLAVKPLYGIPESGLHWYITYRDHHIQQLDMRMCKADNCILYRTHTTSHPKAPDLTILQVDDTFGLGDDKFLHEEERESSKFKTKLRKCLKLGECCDFNGATITRERQGTYLLSQAQKLTSISFPTSKDESISARAKIQYIATTCRPDLASPTQLLSACLETETSKSENMLKKLIHYCNNTSQDGIRFIPQDLESIHLVLFTDSSFGSNDLSSQTGFLIVLMDKHKSANIVHYGSKKCRRVRRSVMAAEVLSLVQGYDEAYIAKHTIQEILNREIPLDAYVDSRTTFNCVAKNSATLEKRLKIDIAAIRQAHMNKEIRTIGWIPGLQNPADGLTKSNILKDDHPLKILLRENRIEFTPTGWAEME